MEAGPTTTTKDSIVDCDHGYVNANGYDYVVDIGVEKTWSTSVFSPDAGPTLGRASGRRHALLAPPRTASVASEHGGALVGFKRGQKVRKSSLDGFGNNSPVYVAFDGTVVK